jgi:hypothetical protein
VQNKKWLAACLTSRDVPHRRYTFWPLRLCMSRLEMFTYLYFRNFCLRSIRKVISLISEAPSFVFDVYVIFIFIFSVFVAFCHKQTLQDWIFISFMESRVSFTFIQLLGNLFLDFLDVLIFLWNKNLKRVRKFFLEYFLEFEFTELFNKFIANYARNVTCLIQGDNRIVFVLYFFW